MSELAARYGYTMDGESISGSEEEYDDWTEDPSEMNEDRGFAGGATPQTTGSGSDERVKRKKDHRGMTFFNMSRIFEVLVRRISIFSMLKYAEIFPAYLKTIPGVTSRKFT